MNKQTLDRVIKTSTAIVHKGKYAYLQANEASTDNHFIVTKDNDEITIVTEEKNIPNVDYFDKVEWFKLIEIRVSEPFVTVGFLAKVTKTIADVGLNILVVSTFSKDYILVRQETYQTAIDALKAIGFPVTNNNAEKF
ncbi:ACT domain-containing protein [Patescibacteria group bacterium]|nr:ACT domain-containing protein [Patescibacteria group bacterium]